MTRRTPRRPFGAKMYAAIDRNGRAWLYALKRDAVAMKQSGDEIIPVSVCEIVPKRKKK